MPNRLPQHLSFQASLLALLLLGGNIFSALPSSLPWIPQPVSVGSSEAAARCGPLPPPAGRTIVVADESALWGAVNEAVPGTTILIEDGTYHLGQNGYYLWIDTPDITLRSKSGNREAVVLDDAYAGTEVITVLASNVTIADHPPGLPATGGDLRAPRSRQPGDRPGRPFAGPG